MPQFIPHSITLAKLVRISSVLQVPYVTTAVKQPLHFVSSACRTTTDARSDRSVAISTSRLARPEFAAGCCLGIYVIVGPA